MIVFLKFFNVILTTSVVCSLDILLDSGLFKAVFGVYYYRETYQTILGLSLSYGH